MATYRTLNGGRVYYALADGNPLAIVARARTPSDNDLDDANDEFGTPDWQMRPATPDEVIDLLRIFSGSSPVVVFETVESPPVRLAVVVS